MLLASLVG